MQSDPTLTTEREHYPGGWIEPMGADLWRVSGNYIYGGDIENVPTKPLAIAILEALDQTADAVRDLCYDSRC